MRGASPFDHPTPVGGIFGYLPDWYCLCEPDGGVAYLVAVMLFFSVYAEFQFDVITCSVVFEA